MSIIDISDFDPRKNPNVFGIHQHANKLLSLKVTRTFQYQSLQSVSQDTQKNDHQMYEEAKTGVNVNEVKNWFVNRYLYSAHEEVLSEQQKNNLDLAKRCFSFLDPEFSFYKILASSNEIMINTPSGVIYYEYLSSGFKSCLSILFGIIKDIEYRFDAPNINAEDFDGIVLIDELELHLHPEWQAKIAKILTKTFPLAQFITATHSPHIIQSANPNEIIALASDDGTVYRREIGGGEYGFQGWTIEEILTDVMGMSGTRTETYREKLSSFESAIENENYKLAKETFKQLDLLLHPDNHFRKLLKLELTSIKGSDL